MKRLNSQQYEAYKAYFVNKISADDYGMDTASMTEEEKVKLVYDCFVSECWKWQKNRGVNMIGAFADWLSGLPSTVNIPFANWEILELAESIYGEKFTEKEEDRILANYWRFMAGIFFKLTKQYKIEAI